MPNAYDHPDSGGGLRGEEGLARQWFKKHMTYKDGSLKVEVLEKDKQGPKRVRLLNRMKNKWTYWSRVMKSDGDILFEIEGSYD